MKRTCAWALVFLFAVNSLGCAPLIVAGAVGAVGGYAISKDAIQGEADTDFDGLWNAALGVASLRGNVTIEDYSKGYIELVVDASKVYIKVIRLTRSATRLRVAARKYHFPNLNLAQDIFVKIMEELR